MDVPCELDLVGDGPDRDAWLDQARAEGWSETVVRSHGRLPPHDVEALLSSTDVVVSVAEHEGAGLAVLEAVGAGLVASVTNTGGGASRWLRDDADGIVVPVGSMDVMAEKLAALAQDPQRLLERSRAGQDRLRAVGLDAGTMVRDFARALDAILARPPGSRPVDVAAAISDDHHERASEDPERCDSFVRETLASAGYQRIAEGTPTPSCDAVIVRVTDPRPSPERVEAWRSSGLGVAISPTLCIEAADAAFDRALARLHDAGCERVALWPTAGALHRIARALDRGITIAGVIDPDARDGNTCLGLPAIEPDRVGSAMKVDGVLVLAETQTLDTNDRITIAKRWNIAVEIAYADDASMPLADVLTAPRSSG